MDRYMFICVYVSIHVCVQVCIHVCMYVCMHRCHVGITGNYIFLFFFFLLLCVGKFLLYFIVQYQERELFLLQKCFFFVFFMVLAIPCSESLLYQEATCERFHASVAGRSFSVSFFLCVFLPLSVCVSLPPLSAPLFSSSLFALCNRSILHRVNNNKVR